MIGQGDQNHESLHLPLGCHSKKSKKKSKAVEATPHNMEDVLKELVAQQARMQAQIMQLLNAGTKKSMNETPPKKEVKPEPKKPVRRSPRRPKKSEQKITPARAKRKSVDVYDFTNEDEEGGPIKRTMSFEKALKSKKRKKPSAKFRSIRKILNAKLHVCLRLIVFTPLFDFVCLSRVQAINKRLFKGNFHSPQGKLKEDTFRAAARPIIREVIGSDYSDEDLPATAYKMCKDIVRKRKVFVFVCFCICIYIH